MTLCLCQMRANILRGSCSNILLLEWMQPEAPDERSPWDLNKVNRMTN